MPEWIALDCHRPAMALEGMTSKSDVISAAVVMEAR